MSGQAARGLNGAPWIDHVPPVHEGAAGKAWKFSHDTSDPRLQVSLGAWLVFAPGAHPFWSWHVVMGIDLGDAEGVQPAVMHYPEAEFELLVMAFSPDFDPPDPRSARPVEHVMEPADACVQFDGVSREQAIEIVELATKACTTGLLVPDSDHRQRWKDSIAMTVQHYREGRH